METKEQKSNIDQPVVSGSADMIIPTNAVRIGKQSFIQNIDEWFCPDCNTKGNANNIDFVMISGKVCEEDSVVQYCCAECFEENLLATFNED